MVYEETDPQYARCNKKLRDVQKWLYKKCIHIRKLTSSDEAVSCLLGQYKYIAEYKTDERESPQEA